MGQGFAKSSLRSLTRPSAWILEPEASTFAENSSWSNKDMDPVPPHKRTWTMLNYVTFWISCAVSVTTWQLGSSMLAIGLSWRQALLAISLGHFILAVVVVLTGTIGARLRVPFTILARSSFGFWFSYFSVISLIVLSMFWFGIQTYIGSKCVYQILKAIWPSIAHLPNHFPANASITTSGMFCYFIYWSIKFPFLFISPQKLRYLFLAKSIIVPPTLLALFIWAFVKVPPSRLIDQWDNRACAFFTSLVFGLSTLSTNISANSLDAGNELAAMYPRYINIRRGQVICAFLGGWALCPWKILARWGHHQNDIRFLTILGSAPGFLNFVSGYTIFLGPMTGIIVTDVCPLYLEIITTA
ncbi:permease for cytosine/purines, uracil, thiamine, allantoin-domain-containing protein [Russula emetica]|nr:permease for cytosine/purines, uracil, thiamine, allantoin-domain-containing protein [Russula emetica]